MQKDNAFLRTAPIGRLLLRLSVPTVAAQLINMLYNIVDRIYIGHMPHEGHLALTGVGICMPIIMFVSAFASLISAGGALRRLSCSRAKALSPSASMPLCCATTGTWLSAR